VLFINDITQSVHSCTCNIFADDVAIYASGNNLNEIQSYLQKGINEINEWYMNNRLKINVQKTNVMVITSRYTKLLNKDLNITLNGNQIQQVDCVKYLGVYVDCNLLWDNHVKQLCKSVSYKLFSLRRLSTSFDTPILNVLYKTTILPCIDYACSVWGNCSVKNRELIYRLQKRAARIVLKKFNPMEVESTEFIRNLKWQSFEKRRDYFLNVLMYKCIHGNAPERLCNEIEMYFDRHGFNTRNADSLNVVVPKPQIELFKQSFKYSGANTWNDLSFEQQNLPSLNLFKIHYKRRLV